MTRISNTSGWLSTAGFPCDNLFQQFWAYKIPPAIKWTAICGDEQHGQCYACCKKAQSYSAGQPVVAVNYGNSDQKAESLKQIPTHLTVPTEELADNNALAPGIQRGMKRFHHLNLCGSLAIIGGL